MKAPCMPFIREHRTYCGEQYMTVDIFQYTQEGQNAATKKRKRREKVTSPKVANGNDKRARRYLSALINTNFGKDDISLTLTYSNENMPESDTEAQKEIRNYMNRVKHRREKLGLTPLKYVLVTEFGVKQTTGELVRIHHHLVVNGGLSRDDLELMWTHERINWKQVEKEDAAGLRIYRSNISRIGFANADRLQEGENGFEALARYLLKSPNGKKRWSSSKNLEKPVRTTNDHKYTRRKLDKLCTSGEIYSRQWWESAYPGYTLAGSAETALEIEQPDEYNNWIVYAKLRKLGNAAAGRRRQKHGQMEGRE